MSDLHTALREHVERTEPWTSPDPAVAIGAGRRRLRRRRALTSAACAVVVAAAGALAVPALTGPDQPRAGHGIDPATQAALERYDAREMPRILDERVSAVLGRSVTDLPEGTFHAGDGQGQELTPAEYDKASGMSITYGAAAEHRWTVSLSHARSEAEGNARKNCEADLAAGYYLTCEVTTTDAGDVVTSRITALRPAREIAGDSGPEMWMAVQSDRLDRVDPDKLWFSHDVKVIHSETFVTYVSEIVKAPSLEAADDLFETPVADLVEIGTDPELVMPAPPLDEGGCGPWTKDPGVSYSC